MRFFILEGHDVVEVHDSLIWGRWLGENTEARTVAVTPVADGEVSTCFIGLGSAIDELKKRPSLPFETMVFGGPAHGAGKRYATWAEAEAGHAAMVERVRAIVEAN